VAKSHALTLAVYQATGSFPKEELFGLTSQMRRCSASIPANIAEGCGRRGNGEFHRFLQISTGSASELEYHLLLARDLHFLADAVFARLTSEVQEVKKMLAGLIRRVDAERLRQ
jgi:four helix bundle protein